MKRQRINRFLLARSADATRTASVVVTGVSGTLVSTGSPEHVGLGVSLAATVPHLDRLAKQLEQRAQRYRARNTPARVRQNERNHRRARREDR